MTAIWPTVVTVRGADGLQITMRGLTRRDHDEWLDLRAANAAWLAPWEATDPYQRRVVSYRRLLRHYGKEAEAGRLQPFALEVEGRLVGQMHLFGMTWGSIRSAAAGYWVAQAYAGRGIAPLALAALVDHAFHGLGLHRVEVNVRPDNTGSLRVVGKLGFRDEGLRRGYVYIDGAWRDHRSFALTVDDLVGGSLVASYNAGTTQRPPLALGSTAGKEASTPRPEQPQTCPE